MAYLVGLDDGHGCCVEGCDEKFMLKGIVKDIINNNIHMVKF